MNNITYELQGVPVKYSKYLMDFGENMSWTEIHSSLKYKNTLPARAGDYIVWNVYDPETGVLLDSVKAKYHSMYFAGKIEVLVDNRRQIEGEPEEHLDVNNWTFNDEHLEEGVVVDIEIVPFTITFSDPVTVKQLEYFVEGEDVHPGLMINGLKCEVGLYPRKTIEGEEILCDALLWKVEDVVRYFAYLPEKPAAEESWLVDSVEVYVNWPHKVSSVQWSENDAIPIKQMYDHQNKCLSPAPFFPRTVFNAVFNENGDTLTTVIERLKNTAKKESIEVVNIDTYLYRIDYKDVESYAFAEHYFKTHSTTAGACSSFRTGNFYGRTYDWYYDASAQFIIYTPAGGERKYASYGISCMDGLLNTHVDESIENAEWLEEYDILPFMIKDGINEKQLVCSMNVVPKDLGQTSETSEAGLHTCLSGIIRRVLDNCATTDEAVNYIIDNKRSWYIPERLSNLYDELHIMISDAEGETREIEFETPDGADYATIIATSLYDYNESTPWASGHRPAVATNFIIKDTVLNGDGTVYSTKDVATGHFPGKVPGGSQVTNYGQGLERYNTIVTAIKNLYQSGNTPDIAWMKNIVGETLKYSNAYTLTGDDCWWTEGVGGYISGDSGDRTTVNSPAADYANVFSQMHNNWENRGERDNGRNVWESSHSSIYDIEKKRLYVRAKEVGEWYEFNFPETYTKAEIDEKIADAGKVKDVVDGATGDSLVDPDTGIATIVQAADLWKKEDDTVKLMDPANVLIDSGTSGRIDINGAEVYVNNSPVISTIDLEPILGDSEEKAMSQKGIKDVIGGYLDEIEVYDVEGFKKDGSIIEAINTLYTLISEISESIG